MLHPGEAETRLLPLAQPPVVLGRQLRAGPGPLGRPLLRVEEERRERPPEGARANGAAEMLASNARAEGGLRALVPGSDAYVEELEVLRRVLRTMNLGDRARRHPPRVEAWRLGNPTLARLAPSLCDGARLATKRLNHLLRGCDSAAARRVHRTRASSRSARSSGRHVFGTALTSPRWSERGSIRRRGSVSDLGYVLVLPGAEHLPSVTCERAVDSTVSGDVASELRLPVRGVRPWRVAVVRAAVPEAAVDEDGEARAREDHVGSNDSGRSRDWVIDPEAQPTSVELRPQSQFRSCVTPTVAAHALAHSSV